MLVFLRPPKIVKLLGLPLVCLAMFSVAGGHWALLQTVAWTKMMWTYSQQADSLLVGAKKTFGGEYPCEMCRKVAEGQKQEEKAPATVKAEKKAETSFPCERFVAEPPPATDFSYGRVATLSFPARFDSPPRPVPRSLVSRLA